MNFLRGRQHRARYLSWGLASLLLLLGGQYLVQRIAPVHGCGPGDAERLAEAIAIINYLLVALVAVRAIVQRLHDLGVSGGWSWVLFAPLLVYSLARLAAAALERSWPVIVGGGLQYAWFWLLGGLLLLALVPGQREGNRFGPAPPRPGGWDRVGVLGLFLLLMFSAVLIAAPGNYAHRAAAHTGYALADGLRVQIAEYWQQHGRLPGPSDLAVPPLPDGDGNSHVRKLELGPKGVITITFRGAGRMPPACDGRTLILRPAIEQQTFGWDCRGGTLPRPMRPTHCRMDR